jgi:hypothetical protein
LNADNLGAGSNFTKGDWYIAITDCGWGGPDQLNFLGEKNITKYRIQRRAIGPAYTVDAVKDYEKLLGSILKKHIEIMVQQAGKSYDVDKFFNFFTSGLYSKSRSALSQLNRIQIVLRPEHWVPVTTC